ncbi:formimidoylglutamase [Pontibacter sp. MBLB2868]|uniref:formimidoylglutamase n=1 Tax=Pontibacter sp. MBLB2868 TaxID=3451555 RepID=UPI003F751C86
MYKPSTNEAWKGRVDVHDGEAGLRWHQAIGLLNLTEQLSPVVPGELSFAFIGFCCDEGVKRNQGRVGAAEGPAAIRAALSSFAYHLPDTVRLFDAGDVICTNQNLEEAQEQLGKKITLLLENGYQPLVLGGGHEVAYGHFLGIEKFSEEHTLGILNFDAHFDLRSYEQQPSSGSPFLQIADRLQNQNKSFIYKVIGLQEYGNTRKLYQTANKLDVNYTTADDVHLYNLHQLKQELNDFLAQVEKVYVTIDMDVFAACYAPGVSAVNAIGIQPEVIKKLMKHVILSGKLLSLDIAELNPAYDIDHRTAKLAASLLYDAVKVWSSKH